MVTERMALSCCWVIRPIFSKILSLSPVYLLCSVEVCKGVFRIDIWLQGNKALDILYSIVDIGREVGGRGEEGEGRGRRLASYHPSRRRSS